MSVPLRQRHSQGQSMVELCAGLIVLIPVIMVLVDLAIMIIAIQVNDATCRDAARAASARSPSDSDKTVDAIIQRVYKGGGYITGPTKINVNKLNVVAPPAGVGGPYQGNIEVETQINVRLPATIPGVLPTTAKFNSKQNFPYTYVEPPTIQPL